MFLISPKSANSDIDWKKAMAVNRVQDPSAFAEFMLTKTSRTFALNIQVLPRRLRNQVLLAYLFCRMADTLEDDSELETDRKIRLLEDFRSLFPPDRNWESRLADFLASLPKEWAGSDRWDHLLVAHSHWIFPLLNDFPNPAIKAISACVQEMCDGMIRFTARQAKSNGDASQPALIETMEDLDRYCYYVAGTVGNLLCELFAIHSPLIGKKRLQSLKSLSVSFGLGLQLTNILKDIHDDRQRNVSYIPQALLAQEHLSEQAFLSLEGRAGATRILVHLLRKAKAHLEDALEYSCRLPILEPRLRLFCLWPLFMAAETVVLIASNLEGIQDETKMKISRSQVKRIVRKTSLACWSNVWIRSMFRTTMEELETRLEKASGLPTPRKTGRFAAGAPT